MRRGRGGGFCSNSKKVRWERGPGPSHSPGGARGDLKRDGLKQRAEMQAQLGGGGAARRHLWGIAQMQNFREVEVKKNPKAKASGTHCIQLLNLPQLGMTEQGFCAGCELLGFFKECIFRHTQNQQERFEAFS